ncbi:MAG: hypothetical protein SF028_03245 [Candidatus Sumerlaeia bacterium]|nr:hypothetical protein [Candidatus Sumerlaeia bacterium]
MSLFSPRPQALPGIGTLEELLESSKASREFREAVVHFAQTQRPNERVVFGRHNPPVKVMRAIMGLLERAPGLAIDSVRVDGESGCSDYRGKAVVNPGEIEFRFVWDCAWRARQEGWEDAFGYPDQQRAAREFGYRCFEVFERTVG